MPLLHLQDFVVAGLCRDALVNLVDGDCESHLSVLDGSFESLVNSQAISWKFDGSTHIEEVWLPPNLFEVRLSQCHVEQNVQYLLRLTVLFVLEQSVQVELFAARRVDFDLELHAPKEDAYWLVEAVDGIESVDALTTDKEGTNGHLKLVGGHHDLDVSLILKEVIRLHLKLILMNHLMLCNLEDELVGGHADGASMGHIHGRALLSLELVTLEASSIHARASPSVTIFPFLPSLILTEISWLSITRV